MEFHRGGNGLGDGSRELISDRGFGQAKTLLLSSQQSKNFRILRFAKRFFHQNRATGTKNDQ